MIRVTVRAAIVLAAVLACGTLTSVAASQRVAQPSSNPDAVHIAGEIIIPVPGFWDNIDVILEFETGAPVAYLHTTAGGNFSFPVSQPGRYFVVIDLAGFEKVRERVDVVIGVPMLPVRIFMVPEGAKEAAAELRRKYPKKAVDEYDKAQDELKKGDLPKVVQRLTAALKEAPTFYDAQLMLGTVSYKMRKMPEAAVAYGKARELNPKALLPMVNLGQLYIESADSGGGGDAAATAKVYQAAYDLLSEAVKVDSSSATAVFLLGVSSYRLNRNDEAESNLKRALELNKRMGQAHVMLANLFIRKQEWQKALDNLDAYLKDNSAAPDAKAIQDTRAKVAERVKATAK